MKASFFKRILAFLFDYFIISLALSIITIGFNINSNGYSKDLNRIVNDYKNGKINNSEYTEKILDLEFNVQKDNLPINGVSCALFVGYFIIFGYLNKGQTIGKKIFNIRVVNKEKENVNFLNMLIRSLFLYGILSTLYSIICVLFFNINVFNYGYKIIGTVESLFLFISFLMVMNRKDGRGLHDLIGGTYVIGEVK